LVSTKSQPDLDKHRQELCPIGKVHWGGIQASSATCRTRCCRCTWYVPTSNLTFVRCAAHQHTHHTQPSPLLILRARACGVYVHNTSPLTTLTPPPQHAHSYLSSKGHEWGGGNNEVCQATARVPLMAVHRDLCNLGIPIHHVSVARTSGGVFVVVRVRVRVRVRMWLV
jgi:hypothetical protein